MASKSKPVNQQKCRKFGLTNGPLRATESFGLKSVEPSRLQTSAVFGSENTKLVSITYQTDAKDSRRSSSPDSPTVLRRGKKGSSSTATIHRSSSFDTISSTYYLSGTWPRVGVPRGRSSSSTSEAISNAQPSQAKSQSRKSSKESNVVGSASLPVVPFVVSSSSSLTSLGKSRRRRHNGVVGNDAATHSRGSLEGLNQELEKLDLSTSSSESSRLDGRRAPVDDLLMTSGHSASDQPLDGDGVPSDVINIPSVEPDVKGGMSGMSGSPPAILDDWLELQRAVTLRSLDNDEHGLNLLPLKAVKRLPPDGCEHFLCKVNELQKQQSSSMNGDTPPIIAYDIPSATSAFCPPPCQNYLCASSDGGPVYEDESITAVE